MFNFVFPQALFALFQINNYPITPLKISAVKYQADQYLISQPRPGYNLHQVPIVLRVYILKYI